MVKGAREFGGGTDTANLGQMRTDYPSLSQYHDGSARLAWLRLHVLTVWMCPTHDGKGDWLCVKPGSPIRFQHDTQEGVERAAAEHFGFTHWKDEQREQSTQ